MKITMLPNIELTKSIASHSQLGQSNTTTRSQNELSKDRDSIKPALHSANEINEGQLAKQQLTEIKSQLLALRKNIRGNGEAHGKVMLTHAKELTKKLQQAAKQYAQVSATDTKLNRETDEFNTLFNDVKAELIRLTYLAKSMLKQKQDIDHAETLLLTQEKITSEPKSFVNKSRNNPLIASQISTRA